MIKDKEAVIYGGMSGKGLKVCSCMWFMFVCHCVRVCVLVVLGLRNSCPKCFLSFPVARFSKDCCACLRACVGVLPSFALYHHP